MASQTFDVQVLLGATGQDRIDYLAQCFDALGFKVTPAANMKTAVLVLENAKKERTLMGMHIRHNRRVPVQTVSGLIRDMADHQAGGGIIVSFSEATPQATALCDQHRIAVWGRTFIEEHMHGVQLRENPYQPVRAIDLMDQEQRERVDKLRDLDPEELSDEEADALNEALRLVEVVDTVRRQEKAKLEYWQPFDYNRPAGPENIGPYDWQMQFHAAGRSFKERCLVAANRIGKTHCGACEVTFHLTGEYPPWWTGKRFTEPTRIWVGSDTNETSREIVQKALLGEKVGTGWIPADRIVSHTYRQAGIPDVVDTVQVRHTSGGNSRLVFKTYEQGRRKWQGTSQHFVWFDEEPPQEIFTEGITRVLDTRGCVILTFTPLNGASDVVMHFLDGGSGIWSFNATWDDAPHLDEEDKAQLLSSYPEHERATRARGVPMVGSGVVFPTPDEDLYCDPFPIPDHYRRICGIDFGIDHPFAAVWLAHDADTDVVYIYDCYKASGQTAAYHADCINARGKWIPVSWPHDGMQRDKAGGEQLKEQYRKKGVNMLELSARYDDQKGGAVAVEPAVLDMDDRMRSGRLKVFPHLSDWFREKRMYHRKDGLIVAEMDDLISASRYGLMMLRFARTNQPTARPSRHEDYDPLARI